MVQLIDYLDDECVLFLGSNTKEEVIKKLVDAVASQNKVSEKDRFYQAIVERENLVSTGVGMGVAIPHAKLNVCSDFFIAVAVLNKGLEWNAIDDSLVRLVFLIGGPENRQTEYLKILSLITSAMRDEHLRKRLMTAATPQAFIAILRAALTR
jgi:nitrogen PTS system EIIA component